MDQRNVTEIRNTEVQDGNTQVVRSSRSETDTAPRNVIIRRVISYLTGFIVALLALRFVLLLLGANEANGFVSLVYGLSGIFAAPFYGIFNYEPVYENSVVEVSTLVAMAIYSLIGWGLAKLFTLGSNHPEA